MVKSFQKNVINSEHQIIFGTPCIKKHESLGGGGKRAVSYSNESTWQAHKKCESCYDTQGPG